MEATTEAPIFDDPYACDVSGWQKPERCDWEAAFQDGMVLAIVKRSQGRGETSSGIEHAKRIAATSVMRGDYHFADTRRKRDRMDPKPQAETFCKAIGDLQPHDSIPWLDLEWHSFGDNAKKREYYSAFTKADNTEWTLEFLDYVEQQLGVRPGIYTLATYPKSRLRPHKDLKRSLLWLAGAGRSKKPPLSQAELPTVEEIEAGWSRPKYAKRLPIPGHFDEWVLYQWTAGGHRDWYRNGKGHIDLNALRYGLATVEYISCGAAERRDELRLKLVGEQLADGAADGAQDGVAS